MKFQTSLPNINWMLALKCEAKPLINYFHLKQIAEKPFALYQGQWRSAKGNTYCIRVCVSGLGQVKMSNAVGWLAAQSSGKTQWFNLGTAGHKNAQIGALFKVYALTQQGQDKAYYLSTLVKSRISYQALMSGDEVVYNYPENSLVDMEGMAFYHSVLLHSSLEFVHILKVVSDNQTHGVDRLKPELLSQYIQQNQSHIVEYMQRCCSLFCAMDETPYKVQEAMQCVAHVARSKSQDVQVQEYFRQLIALHALDENLLRELANSQDIKTLQHHLQNALQACQITLCEET